VSCKSEGVGTRCGQKRSSKEKSTISLLDILEGGLGAAAGRRHDRRGGRHRRHDRVDYRGSQEFCWHRLYRCRLVAAGWRAATCSPLRFDFGVASRCPVHIQEHGVELLLSCAPPPPLLPSAGLLGLAAAVLGLVALIASVSASRPARALLAGCQSVWWGDVIEGTTRESLAKLENKPEAGSEATAFLQVMLKDGPQMAVEIIAKGQGAGSERLLATRRVQCSTSRRLAPPTSRRAGDSGPEKSKSRMGQGTIISS
jgi:hypothetical protein